MQDAKDLIRRLLTVDATKRLSASQALTHPWFTGSTCTEAPVTAETLKKMYAPSQFASTMRLPHQLQARVQPEPQGDDRAPQHGARPHFAAGRQAAAVRRSR